jgi:hypothetical protein
MSHERSEGLGDLPNRDTKHCADDKFGVKMLQPSTVDGLSVTRGQGGSLPVILNCLGQEADRCTGGGTMEAIDNGLKVDNELPVGLKPGQVSVGVGQNPLGDHGVCGLVSILSIHDLQGGAVYG